MPFVALLFSEPKNLFNIYIVTSSQHWIGLAKPKNAFRSTINPSMKSIYMRCIISMQLTGWAWWQNWLTVLGTYCQKKIYTEVLWTWTVNGQALKACHITLYWTRQLVWGVWMHGMAKCETLCIILSGVAIYAKCVKLYRHCYRANINAAAKTTEQHKSKRWTGHPASRLNSWLIIIMVNYNRSAPVYCISF